MHCRCCVLHVDPYFIFTLRVNFEGFYHIELSLVNWSSIWVDCDSSDAVDGDTCHDVIVVVVIMLIMAMTC